MRGRRIMALSARRRGRVDLAVRHLPSIATVCAVVSDIAVAALHGVTPSTRAMTILYPAGIVIIDTTVVVIVIIIVVAVIVDNVGGAFDRVRVACRLGISRRRCSHDRLGCLQARARGDRIGCAPSARHAHVRHARPDRVMNLVGVGCIVDQDGRGRKHGRRRCGHVAVEARKALQHASDLATDTVGRRWHRCGGQRRGRSSGPIVPADARGVCDPRRLITVGLRVAILVAVLVAVDHNHIGHGLLINSGGTKGVGHNAVICAVEVARADKRRRHAHSVARRVVTVARERVDVAHGCHTCHVHRVRDRVVVVGTNVRGSRQIVLCFFSSLSFSISLSFFPLWPNNSCGVQSDRGREQGRQAVALSPEALRYSLSFFLASLLLLLLFPLFSLYWARAEQIAVVVVATRWWGARIGRKGKKSGRATPVVFPCWAAPFGGGDAVRATAAHWACSPSPPLSHFSSLSLTRAHLSVCFAPCVSLWPRAVCSFFSLSRFHFLHSSFMKNQRRFVFWRMSARVRASHDRARAPTGKSRQVPTCAKIKGK